MTLIDALARAIGRTTAVALLMGAATAQLHAQDHAASLRVEITSEDGAVAGIEVRAGARAALTDSAGRATFRLPAGPYTIRVRGPGYRPVSVAVLVHAARDTTIRLQLDREVIEFEEIVVQSTRTPRRIEDEPVRVEVLAREEIEEKLLMTPGDISMMLNETSGLRVQTTSPSLGGANVRVQGLRGRYTQILSDGLPLYGGQSGALSMLQIPPMDLGQVEVIKGVASALYGGSALGGVVNLISRRPARDGENELLLNQTTRAGTDAVLWSSGALSERWGYTFLGSAHRQGIHDANDDGWADLPGYRRAVVRPRLFWDDAAGRSIFVTAGATIEDRDGGTVPGEVTPAGTPYAEALETRRGDGGLVGRLLLGADRLLTLRASGTVQRHDHRFGTTRERDRHATGFAEGALTGTDGAHTWVLGLALQYEGYEGDDVSRFDFTHRTASLFAQDELAPTSALTVAASARLDAHSEYGAIFNPRISVLLRPGAAWNVRASLGTGYFAPTPFTEETEVIGLAPVLIADDLALERARSVSLDVGRTLGHFELNGTLFGSIVNDPLTVLRVGDGSVELLNATGPTRTWGTDLLLRYHREPLHITATYTHTRSTELDPELGTRREAPLTPRNAAGIVGMWEAENDGRVGIEGYYVGRQDLDDNPFRDRSRAYLILGFLAERRLGRARLFLNAENLLDARQSRWEPVVLPARTPEGRWTTDAWAPLEGRTFNAGLRLAF